MKIWKLVEECGHCKQTEELHDECGNCDEHCECEDED